jgi:hypothetical protein
VANLKQLNRPLRLVSHKAGDFAVVVAALPKRELNLRDNTVTKGHLDWFGIDAVLGRGLTSKGGRSGAPPYLFVARIPSDREARQRDRKHQCASRNSF